MVFLHGIAKRGDTLEELEELKKDGPPMIVEDQLDFPFIVLSPQCPSDEYWESQYDSLERLLDDIVDTYAVDTDRIYLTGLSMGGYGSWWLATAYPDRFAAVISVSGSGYRTPVPPEEETVCKLRDTPLWAIHGDRDMISDPTANKIQVLALAACGGEVEWTLYSDMGHGETYEYAYRDPALYTWFLQHSREQE
jgi:predicted peptidase